VLIKHTGAELQSTNGRWWLALEDHGSERTLKGLYEVATMQRLQAPSPAMTLQGLAVGTILGLRLVHCPCDGEV
jgi:hypothetical protein